MYCFTETEKECISNDLDRFEISQCLTSNKASRKKKRFKSDRFDLSLSGQSAT
jgi:hypothetical protein